MTVSYLLASVRMRRVMSANMLCRTRRILRWLVAGLGIVGCPCVLREHRGIDGMCRVGIEVLNLLWGAWMGSWDWK